MGWKYWRGEQLATMLNTACCQAVEKTCYVILEASQQQVPLREGNLMRSGMVHMDKNQLPIGYISYGGGEGTGHQRIPYAVRWHENNANFQRGRKMRYLADPLNMIGPSTLQKALRMEVGRILGGIL